MYRAARQGQAADTSSWQFNYQARRGVQTAGARIATLPLLLSSAAAWRPHQAGDWQQASSQW